LKSLRLQQAVRRVLGSPLGVAVSIALAVGSWSFSYRGPGYSIPTMNSRVAHAQDEGLTPMGMHVPIPPAARSSASAALGRAVVGPRPVPRLRAPYAPNGTPGLEIALQDADGRSMNHLHAALARAQAGQGQARLLFWGASHTAADIYTGYLRHALQTMFGDAGHGFVLPVQPWRGYSHGDVRIARMSGEWNAIKVGAPAAVEDYYGLAGVAVESSSPEASAFVETSGGAFGSRVSQFDLYYMKQPNGGAFDVLLDGERVERVRTTSSTRGSGYVTVNADDGPHRLEIRVLGTGPVRLFGVAAERQTPGVIVDVHGINGSRARSHLFWNDAMYREQLARRAPDLVVLAYGTNESGDDNQPIEDYERNLELVVRRIRESVPNASCLLVGPSDRPVETGDGQWVDRPRTAQIIETQWRVALANGCAFFDVVAFQGGSMSTVSWSDMAPPYAGRDHVHFTRLGYERMGQVLLGAMLEGTSYSIPNVAEFGTELTSDP
jgi:lysophospholipase L1-like esterase